MLGVAVNVAVIIYEGNPRETIELAFFSLDELPQEIAFGHKKPITDAFKVLVASVCDRK